jgi:hypothetical protein
MTSQYGSCHLETFGLIRLNSVRDLLLNEPQPDFCDPLLRDASCQPFDAVGTNHISTGPGIPPMNPWDRVWHLTLISLLPILLPACSTHPQTHPLDTAPVPANVTHFEQCSTWGVMACNMMSTLSGDAGAERRSACTAFKDANGTRIETCGSLPASHP